MFEGARKAALVFLAAVLAPSLLLAWLAFRTLRDQEIVLEAEKTRACLSEAERAATELRFHLDALPSDLSRRVEAFCRSNGGPIEIAPIWDALITKDWPLAKVGFAVTDDGRRYSPTADSTNPAVPQFLASNEAFFGNRVVTQAYVVGKNGTVSQQQLDLPQQKSMPELKKMSSSIRNVDQQSPQLEVWDNAFNTSKLTVSEGSFRSLLSGASNGTLARFVDDRMQLLAWVRAPEEKPLIFGAELNIIQLVERLREPFQQQTVSRGVAFALLDDRGAPRLVSQPGFAPPNWRKPFVSVEIGEVLPHWEVSAYLLDPGEINRGVEAIRWMLGGLIALLVLSITVGGWLVLSDVRRQLALARQRSDFVSNVSHELKTPLTSIRMFSEMLAQDRVADAEKRNRYLRIICNETARLARLINNVLNFARLERGEKRYQLKPVDLTALVEPVVESCRESVEQSGLSITFSSPPGPVTIQADADAIAQIVLNLISNAEKYASAGKTLSIRLGIADHTAFAEFCDRGPGIPPGLENRIFDRFFRVDSSLDSGTAGTGIGLTLSRQIARDHGGDLAYSPQPEGGSCFRLTLPTLASPDASP